MKKTLILLLLGSILLTSCERASLGLTDNSFKYGIEVVCDKTTAKYNMIITLTSGSREDEYTLDYTIDGNKSLCLLDSEGNNIESGFPIRFTEAVTRSYRIPTLTEGGHTIEAILSSKKYSKKEVCNFTIDKVPFAVHAEVNTSAKVPTSVLLVSLQDGLQTRDYSIRVKIDTAEVDIPKELSVINFSKTPIFSLSLPQVRPGEHTLTLTLDDSFLESCVDISFNEPARFPTLDLTLAYNPNSGNHELTIRDNPYGIRVKADSKLVVTGKTTYYEPLPNGWTYDNPYDHPSTSTKTLDGELSIDTISEGVFTLAERDKIAKEITSSYIFSAMYVLTGNSDDSYYRVSGYEPVYYKIVEETLTVKFDIEKVPGIRPILHNNIPECSASGIE